MSEKESKWQRHSELLCARITLKKAAETIDVSCVTVFRVQKAINDGNVESISQASDRHNKKHTFDMMDHFGNRIKDDSHHHHVSNGMLMRR